MPSHTHAILKCDGLIAHTRNTKHDTELRALLSLSNQHITSSRHHKWRQLQKIFITRGWWNVIMRFTGPRCLRENLYNHYKGNRRLSRSRYRKKIYFFQQPSRSTWKTSAIDWLGTTADCRRWMAVNMWWWFWHHFLRLVSDLSLPLPNTVMSNC